MYTIPNNTDHIDAGLLFFLIKRAKDDINIDSDEWIMDPISTDLPRVRKIKGSYIYAGRTTGIMLDERDANFELYMSMANQCEDIIRNMKELN